MSARSFDLNKVNKKQSNIVVRLEEGLYPDSVKTVYLHGHAIVRIHNDYVVLDSCGWLTNTTKTAINNALNQLGLSQFKVSQVKGQWFINGDKFRDGYEVKRLKLIESMNNLKEAV